MTHRSKLSSSVHERYHYRSPSSPSPSSTRNRRILSESATDETIDSPAALRIGIPAPPFVARTIADGQRASIVKLDEYIGKTCIVLFFCPVDVNTVVPLEVLAFSDQAERFRSQGCEVILLSTDSEIRLRKLTRTPRDRGGLGHLEVVLGVDKGGKIARQYGSVNSSLEPIRGVFMINTAGVICRAAIDTLPVGWSVVDETLGLVESTFGKNFKIAVNKPFRACAFVDIKSSDTVESLKRKLGLTTKAWSVLFHNGRRLKDGATLGSCGVESGASITIIETTDIMIVVAFPPPHGVDVVWISPAETVEGFKRTIERLRSFPVSDQRLFFAGSELSEPTKTLAECAIAKESLIQVSLLRRLPTPCSGMPLKQ